MSIRNKSRAGWNSIGLYEVVLTRTSEIRQTDMMWDTFLLHDVTEDLDVDLWITGANGEGIHVGLAYDAQALGHYTQNMYKKMW